MDKTVIHVALVSRGAAAALAAGTQPAGPGAAARRSQLARVVLHALLSRVTGREDWVLRTAASGKPYLLDDGPAISLSHSSEMIAAAVDLAGRPLGIDLECHKPRDFHAIAAQWFGPHERAAVARTGIAAFYRIWTAREARAKALGTGLAEALRAGDTVGAGSGNTVGAGSGDGWISGGFWFFHDRPVPGYSLTIATQGEAPRPVAYMSVDTRVDVTTAPRRGGR